jgi:tRNA(Arg) A34 adenosine deaminase TadA
MGKFTNAASSLQTALKANDTKKAPGAWLPAYTTGKKDGDIKKISWQESFWEGQSHCTCGAIMVRCLEGNTYYVVTASQQESVKDHVEVNLINNLTKMLPKGLAGIPGNSKIIFFCYYSPCKLCMGSTVKDFVGAVYPKDKKKRNIQISFVFDKFYLTKGNLQGTYETEAAARTAYAEFAETITKTCGHVTIGGKLRQRVVFRLKSETRDVPGEGISTRIAPDDTAVAPGLGQSTGGNGSGVKNGKQEKKM